MYLGLFPLADTLQAAISITIADVAIDPSGGSPTYRIYQGDSLIASGVGTLSQMDTGSITGATNASPIEITSSAHGLQTGNVVTVTNVGGNTAANGTFSITRTGANTFTLTGTTGSGAYTSGGNWHVTGLYLLSFDVLSASGFEIGKTYQVRIDFVNSSNEYCKMAYFAVT